VLQSDRPALLVMLKATFAAAAAFELARTTIGSSIPALAAMAAIITVQVSGSQTVRRALEYSLGVTAGVIVAIGLTRLTGVHWWSIALLLFLSLLAGRLIRLGTQANQIAISALLVMSLGSSYGWTRIIDALIGGAVGIVTSLAVPTPSRERTLRLQIAAAAAELSIAVRSMSTGVRDGSSADELRDALGAARAVSRLLVDPRASIETARDEPRFSLAGRQIGDSPRLDRADAAVTALDHATNEVRSLGRSLVAIALDERTVGEPDRAALSTLLDAVARAVDAWQVAAAADNPAEHLDGLREALTWATDVRISIQGDGELAPLGPLWVSLLVDIERITGELDPAGTHGAALAGRVMLRSS
jgi:uncharacterized membrane protein YccC